MSLNPKHNFNGIEYYREGIFYSMVEVKDVKKDLQKQGYLVRVTKQTKNMG